MAIVNGIGAVLKAIINSVVAVFDIIVSCLTCQGFGGRHRRHRVGGGGMHAHGGMRTTV
jgi:hypothetical protein